MKKAAAFLLFFLTIISAQQYPLKGKIYDSETGNYLSFANLRIQNTFRGTSSNSEGEFEIKLEEGDYNIISSYIGFVSDTIRVKIPHDDYIEIKLKPVTINLPEVTVFPGENPAEQIIRKTIDSKNKRKDNLQDYSFTAYTKTIVKTTKDLSQKRESEFTITALDTGQLKITALLENESKGYFKFPDYYKDVIIARKQSENLPPAANIIAGGRVLVDFYNEEIELVREPLTGPIADDALDYYYYIIDDTLAIDNSNVFKINFEPIDKSDPGLIGELYIKDRSFDLIKVMTGITEAANPMGLFDDFVVIQQYAQFDDKIYLPVDFRFNLEGNFLGIAKFGFELNSIFNNYEINTGIKDDFFDYAIVTVKPDADKKDSLFWQTIQSIPVTSEEDYAYRRIDSLEAIPVSFWDNFSFFSSDIKVSENLFVSGPLGLYGFNKVEGHIAKFGFEINNALNRRLNLNGHFSYGFSDKKFKKEIRSRYYLGEYRTHNVTFAAYDKINSLFNESDLYGDFLSVILGLMTKYDYRNYFYSRGLEFDFSSEVLPFLSLDFGYLYREDKPAINNSNFSIFKPNQSYSNNKQILASDISALNMGFELDFRSYIENGYRRIRMSEGEEYFLFSGKVTLSNDWLAESEYDFEIYRFNLFGKFKTFRSADLQIDITGVFSDGAVPYHYMYALPGNLNGMGQRFSFRTLNIGEVFGDRVLSLGLEQDFKDELFRVWDVPFLREWGMTLGLHTNIAWVVINDASKNIISVNHVTYYRPFIEAGFSVGQRNFPLLLEFTWKLNHFGGSNFVWGVNVFQM